MSPSALPVSELRVLYIGARIVGYRCLEALLDTGANVAGLLTLDERKAKTTTAFKRFDDLIERYALNARTFSDLNSESIVQWAKELKPHVGIVVGVSQLVGEPMLRLPPRGFIGMHPTLLPRGRGRAPIPWALIKGLRRTGVSLFYCTTGADEGDLLAQEEVPIYYEDVSETLGARTDRTASRLFVQSLPMLAAGTAPRLPQKETAATSWPRRRPKDGVIDWARRASDLYNWIRALTHPYPGAFTFLGGRKLWVWSARESRDERRGPPGKVLSLLPHGVLVAALDSSLLLTHVQWEGKSELPAGEAGLQAEDQLGL